MYFIIEKPPSSTFGETKTYHLTPFLDHRKMCRYRTSLIAHGWKDISVGSILGLFEGLETVLPKLITQQFILLTSKEKE